jgi:primosomal protein N' (replication factor Y)
LFTPPPESHPDTPVAAASAPLFAEVLIDGLNLERGEPYTYRIPPQWHAAVRVGVPVLVPFGNQRHVAGYVIGVTEQPPTNIQLRDLEDVVMGEVLPPSLQGLLPWLADTTMSPMTDVIKTVMPVGTLSRIQRRVRTRPKGLLPLQGLTQDNGLSGEIARRLCQHPEVSLHQLKTAGKRVPALLASWRAQGWIEFSTVFLSPRKGERRHLVATARDGGNPTQLTPRQAAVLEALIARGGKLPVSQLLRETKSDAALLRRLEKQGCLNIEQLPLRRTTHAGEATESPPDLTPQQQQVLERLRAQAGNPHTFLLHGATGSGKTEIYLRMIADALEQGGSAIVLVPEISLTPQTVRRFQARFGDAVAVLHSHLSPGERYDEWQRIRQGEASVVVGARSAIFAPVTGLRIIVLDEEHEGSYKQENSPRYHAREVALERARREGATVILGSATPSLESYVAAQRGIYTLLSMPDRVGERPLPPVEVVDMRAELKQGHRGTFSRSLVRAMKEVLTHGEQAILLLNRRGYSSFVFCRECGYTCRCERCSVALTQHNNPPHLRCHYCDARAPVPDTCPQCRGPYIRHFGAGTQQIEEACRQQFPDARVVRIDRDTTRRKGSHAALLDAFGRGEFDVLVGTQMVAKGLDFPRVTLVGVMAADAALNLPDFRAGERTFQLLTQVAGRAGRHQLPGRVVVQAYEPDSPAIQAASSHDYGAFIASEIPDREMLAWPPFGELAVVLLSGPDLLQVCQVGRKLATKLNEISPCEIFGPHEAPVAKVRGLHRQQIIIKAPSLHSVRPLLRQALAHAQSPGVRIGLDLNPNQLL